MVDWTEVNERRIGEKTQEILLYCSQKRSNMTVRAFELAQLSLQRLLLNIIDRNPAYKSIPETVLNSIQNQSYKVASCSEKQAVALAKTIVYKAIGDDLDLYPVKAVQKVQHSITRGESMCHIPLDEMTSEDMYFVVHAAMHNTVFSQETVRSIFDFFRKLDLDPYQVRILAECYFSDKPLILRQIPHYFSSSPNYQKAADELVEKEYLRLIENGVYERTVKRPGESKPSEEFNEPIIRLAEARDLPGVNNLLEQVLKVHNAGRPDLFYETGKKYTDRQLLEIFANPETPVFVYKDGDAVLGYAFCVVQHQSTGALKPVKTLYLDDLCVDEQARGQHIGKNLFEYVKTFAKKKGCYNITLHVWECNPGAKAFYESLGLAPQYTSMEVIC